jgi:hypothetical protein
MAERAIPHYLKKNMLIDRSNLNTHYLIAVMLPQLLMRGHAKEDDT